MIDQLEKLEKLDIAECPQIEANGLLRWFEYNGDIIKYLDCSNCQDALTDEMI
jgi:hypothetical protein